MQLVLFGGFGLGIYGYVTTAFDFDAAEGDTSVVTVESSFATLRTGILLAYLALVVVIPVSSYLLAGLALRPVRASLEAQQRFIDDASHEFRTPLSAIQAQLELGLSKPRAPEESRILMARALRASTQLNAILDDLLVLSRGSHDITANRREVTLNRIISAAIDQLSSTDELRIDQRGNDTLAVDASASTLVRAILNLLTNALRHSPEGSTVTIAVSKRGSFGRISIEDHGRGMTAAERSRAFDRFWQADSSRSTGGSGLGLSIVHEIATMHGGRVGLDPRSDSRPGTVAWIEIPLSR